MVFDSHVTTFLKEIERTVVHKHGVAVVSGSAALLEAVHVSDRDHDRIVPNDIDVFVHMPPVSYARDESERNLQEFLDSLENFSSMSFYTVRQLDWSTNCYRMKYGNDMEVWGILDLRFSTHTGREHPYKIQLIFLYHFDDPSKWWPTYHITEEEFASEALGSFDINICRAWFRLKDRTVSFPCDPKDFDYVMQGSFYVKQRKLSGISFQRIKKYQDRGFTNKGYYDPATDMLHILGSNLIVQCSRQLDLHRLLLNEGMVSDSEDSD